MAKKKNEKAKIPHAQTFQTKHHGIPFWFLSIRGTPLFLQVLSLRFPILSQGMSNIIAVFFRHASNIVPVRTWWCPETPQRHHQNEKICWKNIFYKVFKKKTAPKKMENWKRRKTAIPTILGTSSTIKGVWHSLPKQFADCMRTTMPLRKKKKKKRTRREIEEKEKRRRGKTEKKDREKQRVEICRNG